MLYQFLAIKRPLCILSSPMLHEHRSEISIGIFLPLLTSMPQSPMIYKDTYRHASFFLILAAKSVGGFGVVTLDFGPGAPGAIRSMEKPIS